MENSGFINITMEKYNEHQQTFIRDNTHSYQDDFIFIKGNEKNGILI
jgi:hypothetical protein